ncbi:unnamed protein product, partial [Staurois parvus]
MSEQHRYPQMTPFCKVDSPTYFIRGMASFFEVVFFFVFFLSIFRKIKKLFSFFFFF